MALRALLQRLLGQTPSADGRLQLRLDRAALRAGVADARLGPAQLSGALAQLLAGQLPAGFERLALEPPVQLAPLQPGA